MCIAIRRALQSDLERYAPGSRQLPGCPDLNRLCPGRRKVRRNSIALLHYRTYRANIHTYIDINTQLYTPYIHSYLKRNTYIHTYIHTFVYTVHTYIRTFILSYIHTTYIYTYIHTYIPAFTHTYIRIYINTYLCYVIAVPILQGAAYLSGSS